MPYFISHSVLFYLFDGTLFSTKIFHSSRDESLLWSVNFIYIELIHFCCRFSKSINNILTMFLTLIFINKKMYFYCTCTSQQQTNNYFILSLMFYFDIRVVLNLLVIEIKIFSSLYCIETSLIQTSLRPTFMLGIDRVFSLSRLN